MVFSLSVYERLLDTIGEAGRATKGVAQALAVPDGDFSHTMVLRHDVDRFPSRAVHVAALERRRSVATTYYFRASRSGRFPARAVRMISDLGHEVGYHYETLSQCRGQMDEARVAFWRNLDEFRTIAPCTTICMHGAPFSRHDNMTILDHLDLTALGLRGDAFRHMALLNPIYLTDTGGRWNADRDVNRRDAIGGVNVTLPDPGDVVAFRKFLAATQQLVYINVHPERWPSSAAGRLQASMTDGLVNLAKRALLKLAKKPGT